jgi:outer membrane protein OmpA-like peptidoglycan-associated protein
MPATRFTVVSLAVAALVLNGCSATRPAPPLRCAAVGAMAGGLSGAISGVAWEEGNDAGQTALMGTGIGVAAGALIGYGICALMPERQVAQAAPPPPPPPPPAAPVVKKKIVLPGVSFALNSATLSAGATAVIDREVVPIMREHPDLTVKVEGFTDSSGAAQYNQALSERRARAVRDHLMAAAGISGSRIEAAGYGAAQPVASNDTADGRAENRRVEIKVLEY